MKLYPYQEKVKTLIQGGKSVILQAPTGAGKTRAALIPFIENFFDNSSDDFPRKCIYAVPMRVLANQFVAEYGGLAAGYRRRHGRELSVRIQTGEQPMDRQFEADLTFATIDQVLSSFLHMPYSLPRKLANMNAGAVVASYLVFDEFHLFDPVSTLPTTLEMLRMMRTVAPFVLMTATFSGKMLGRLAEWLNAQVVPGSEVERDEMLNLPVERSKKRYYHWLGESLNADRIVEQHKHRSMVVCNSVERAQKIYGELRNHPDLNNTEVFLLHARFLPEDRSAKEQRVRDLFGKSVDRASGSAIIVATQVVEVGLDISAEVLHTELAPANAVLQRAGRCARFQDETGHVYVYPVESPLPYKGQEVVIQLTGQWLQDHDGMRLNFVDEQALVDFAHGAFDEKLLQGVMATTWKHRQRMQAALNGDREAAGDLVRKITSQQITISADPEALLARPFTAPMFSLHPGTLQGKAKAWLEDPAISSDSDLIWRLQEAQDSEQENDVPQYFWQPVRTESMLRGASLVAIHPALADYNADEGLVLGRSGAFNAEDHVAASSAAGRKGSDWVTFYRLESYEDHIRLVYEAFEQTTWKELERAAARLERRAGWPTGSLKRAAMLAVLFHDLGKLARAWQQWVTDWQKTIGKPVEGEFWAAHTDFDGLNARHVELQRKMRRRPPHAVESAVASSPLLAATLREHSQLLKAAFSAIARHHGAFSSNFQPYELAGSARTPVRKTIDLAPDLAYVLDPSKLRSSDDPNRTTAKAISSMFTDAANNDGLLAYMLLARALRRADQLGTAEGTRMP